MNPHHIPASPRIWDGRVDLERPMSGHKGWFSLLSFLVLWIWGMFLISSLVCSFCHFTWSAAHCGSVQVNVYKQLLVPQFPPGIWFQHQTVRVLLFVCIAHCFSMFSHSVTALLNSNVRSCVTPSNSRHNYTFYSSSFPERDVRNTCHQVKLVALNDLPYSSLISVPTWHLISAPDGESITIYIYIYIYRVSH